MIGMREIEEIEKEEEKKGKRIKGEWYVKKKLCNRKGKD